MRAGGCTVQQALTPEAATLVKQAITLARRRGHAQVTPLHVANTMLSSSTGLLRIACLQSHSHPLQCKALELCFNVALNRLPASTSSGPMPGTHLYNHHHYPPSLSNALIAAFKRAQAHQRRGSIETQQQPLLAVKIELEQLIISILDDPSVSRVMREAGFSSTQVKSNVEQALSLETSPLAPTEDEETNLLTTPQGRNEDVRSLIDCLMSRRKRSIVLVGESLTATEGVMKGVMEMINKEEVPDFLRNLHLVTLPLDSFSFMSREEVDHKVRELRCLVKRGGILFLGDLKWAAQYKLGGEGKGRSHYRPVEHVIMEISNLLMGGGSGRFWVMGIATYQTYMRCRIGNPSLEAVWGLQPLAVPAGSLELTLKLDSKKIRAGPSWSLLEGAENQLKCCADCSLKFEAEARALPNISSTSHGSITSNLPSWLQQYKDERKKEASNDQGWIQNLCNKWNSICYSSHKHQTLNFSSISPSSSISSYNNHHSSCFHVQTHEPWPVPLRTMNPRASEPDHWLGKGLELMSNPNSSSSSDTMDTKPLNKFKELNAENVKILCNTLERKVPWQGDIISKVVSTILQCRSGMVRRKERSILAGMKEETWLLFLGEDVNGKEKVARELASLVFHSRASVVSIGFSGFTSTRSGSNDDGLNKKRSRSEPSHGYLERLAEAISDNPHRVILMEGIEQLDSSSQMGIKTAIERGRIMRSNGEELNVCDAIFILCCESFDSISRACSPRAKQKSESDEGKDEDGEKEMSSFLCLDLDLNLSVGDDCSFDDVGLLEAVDGTFFFKSPEL